MVRLISVIRSISKMLYFEKEYRIYLRRILGRIYIKLDVFEREF